ncbi:glutamate receptor ionotropic, NMDA 1 [Hydra vulgaris]|uniref:glutamate receptor ionotropic, NMDA 1 n=1 Tax=Hydra vulgaris TaxID=6087 RepID=UPI001F5F3690|nr:glutamate receptor ionotropic, NMDA 1-like [Hydra vulgaris]
MQSFYAIIFCAIILNAAQVNNTLVNNNQLKCVAQIIENLNTIAIRITTFNSSTCEIQTSNLVYESNNMILITKYISESLSACIVQLLVDKTIENVISYFLSSTHNLINEYEFYTKFDKSFNDSQNVCNNPNHPYINMFLQIALLLDINWIGIFIHDGECKEQFVEMIRKSLLQEKNNSENLFFTIEVFKVRNSLLMNTINKLKSLNEPQRLYIALTPVHITTSLFNYLEISSPSQVQKIWVIQHNVYEKIPEVTITFTGIQQNIYKQNDCLEDCYKCLWIDDILYKNTIEVQLYQNKQWQMLFEMHQEHQNITYIPYIEESNLKEKLGLTIQEVLRVVSIIEPPFLFFADYLYNINTSSCEENTEVCEFANNVNNQKNWIKSCCFGYTVDFLNILRARTSLKYKLYLVEDQKYGGYNSTTMKFNGMIGDIIEQKADLAIAGLTISLIRSNFVDFTSPFMAVDLGIITALNELDNNYLNWNFIANLGPAPRYTLIILFIAGYLTVYTFDNFTLYRKWKLGPKIKEFLPFKWNDCFLYITGLMFQKDLGKINPSTSGGRTTAVVFAFAFVAWTALYTASLTANQVTKPENIFKGFKDTKMTNPTTNFKFGTTASTSIEDFFKNAQDEKLNRIYRFMSQHKYNVKNASDGIKKVISGELNAYINEYPFLLAMMTNFSQCTLKITPASEGQTFYGIAVRKNSTLKDLLSKAIIQSQDDNQLNELQSIWMKTCDNSPPNHNEFSLILFATPLLLLLGTIFITVILLLFEIQIVKYMQKKRKIVHISGDLDRKPPTWQNLKFVFDETNI